MHELDVILHDEDVVISVIAFVASHRDLEAVEIRLMIEQSPFSGGFVVAQLAFEFPLFSLAFNAGVILITNTFSPSPVFGRFSSVFEPHVVAKVLHVVS